MKFAILGGGGCFGLNLARHLIGAGHEAIGCGRSALRGEAFTLGADRMGYRYRQFAVGPDSEFIVEWLKHERPDVVVNFAAQGEGAASYRARHWKFFYRTNVSALVELTEAFLEFDWLEAFVQVGTSEVYGGVAEPAREDAPLRPTSPYAVSKLAFDLHLQSIAKLFGFPAVIVRPSNCLTVGQQLHRIVPKTFVSAMTGRKVPLHGGGEAQKSYLDATDLSRAILLLAEKGAPGEIYNCGPAVPTSIRKLVALCAASIGRGIEDVSEDVPDRTGQDSVYWLDSTKLRALGWAPTINLGEAIDAVRDWVANYLDVLKNLPLDYEMRA